MNHLIVSGVNHKTADLAAREHLSVQQNRLPEALAALRSMPHIEEAIILSTCNRTEVYATVSNIREGFRDIDSFFANGRITEGSPLKTNYRLINDDVALHLFRVASGLSSMILGEPQIAGQIKSAQRLAREMGTSGPVLNRLFDSSLRCGKQVRSRTDLGRLALSMGSAAIALAENKLGTLRGRKAVVLGTGRMAEICLKLLAGKCEVSNIVSINRSKGKKNVYPCRQRAYKAAPWAARQRLVASADLVIVAASSPDYVLRKDPLARLLEEESNKVLIIDISVPRNVEPCVAELERVSLFHTDDLQFLQPDPAERAALIAQAEEIVFQQLEEYVRGLKALAVVPAIIEMRVRAELIRREHMASAKLFPDRIKSPADLYPDLKDRLDRISKAMVNEILHEPTIRLKQLSEADNGQHLEEALRILFEPDGW